MKNVSRLFLGTLACAVAFGTSAARAEFPDHSVELVVCSNAGGGIDSVARLIASNLEKKWGQTVVVLNKPGSKTMIAEGYVAHAAPDGYTILMCNAQRTVNAAEGMTDAGYDIVNGFTPITQVAKQPQMLVVNPNVPAKTLPEFVAYAKANPNKLNYGDSGRGSANDLGTKLLMQKTGTELFEISYKTMAEAMTSVMGGDIHLMMGSVLQLSPQIKAGTVLALGIADDQRDPNFPDVPTIAEALGIDSFIFDSWYGIYAPAGTPDDIVGKLNEDIVSVIKLPEVSGTLEKSGLTVIASKPDAFAKVVAQQTAAWRGVMAAFPAK